MNELIDTFSNRLNEAIRINNIKPIELSEKTGIDKSKISSYMSGRYKAKQDGIYLLAKALNVSEAWLMGLDVPMQRITTNIQPLDKETKSSAIVFIYGTIPAGVPMECIEDIIDTEEIDSDMLKGGKQYFGLKIKGDSMYPEYLDNDTIILEKVDDCESGDDCVVMVNGNDGTFKRVFKNQNGIILQPLNNNYQPMIYTNEQIEELPIRVIGKVIELRRRKK